MCVQQVDEDDENWTYRSQQRKGDLLSSLTLVTAAEVSALLHAAPSSCSGPTGSRELQVGEEEEEEGSTKAEVQHCLSKFFWG